MAKILVSMETKGPAEADDAGRGGVGFICQGADIEICGRIWV